MQRLGLTLHLLVCSWCRRFGRKVRFLQNAAVEGVDEGERQALSSETRERMKKSLGWRCRGSNQKGK
jgi:hypothetical protein